MSLNLNFYVGLADRICQAGGYSFDAEQILQNMEHEMFLLQKKWFCLLTNLTTTQSHYISVTFQRVFAFGSNLQKKKDAKSLS